MTMTRWSCSLVECCHRRKQSTCWNP